MLIFLAPLVTLVTVIYSAAWGARLGVEHAAFVLVTSRTLIEKQDRDQARRAVLLIAAQPLANGGHGGDEQPRGSFDAALLGALDQTKAMVVRIVHLTDQIEIAGDVGHDAAILSGAPDRTAVEKTLRLKIPFTPRDFHFPTAATTTIPSAPCASGSCPSTPPGGYDVTGLFQFGDVSNRAIPQ